MAPAKAGRYELLEEIGRGAMGVVYRSRDPLIGRTVAVKTLRLDDVRQGKSESETIDRFQNEIRAAGRLAHPGIVTIHDAGVDSDAGLFYITMEFVQGRSLSRLIEDKQAFPLPRVMRILDQACRALDYAHESHIVHRDIKPANILMGELDAVKLTDFGTAKILERGGTQSGQIVGTPSYMAPEQVKGRAVDGRADIFALACILYELLTGERPFPGKNVTTVIYKIVNEDPVAPMQLDSSIHPGLNAVILKGLAKDPEQRYAACGDFLSALKSYRESPLANAGGGQTVVRRVSVLASPRPVIAGQTVPGVRGAAPQPDTATQFSASPGATTPPALKTPPPKTAPLKTTTGVPLQAAAQAQEGHRPPAAMPAAPPVIPRVATEEPKGGRAGVFVLALLVLVAGGAAAYMHPEVVESVWREVTGKAQPAETTAAPQETKPAADPAAAPQGSPEAAAPAAKSLAPAVAAARRPVGTLDVLSVPVGADILINGSNTGRHTPAKLELPAGKYEVTLYLKGYAPFEQGTAIQQGRVVQIEAILAHR